MQIRLTGEKDIDGILRLLGQVLKVHADIRPDIFKHDTTKYGRDELCKLMGDSNKPIYGAFDDEENLLGYVFCSFEEQEDDGLHVPFKYMYIDDLCVDEEARGGGVAKSLFEHAVSKAKERGCREVTLNVWEGNDRAKKFYEKMGLTPQKTYMEFKF